MNREFRIEIEKIDEAYIYYHEKRSGTIPDLISICRKSRVVFVHFSQYQKLIICEAILAGTGLL